jgi:hypothetical protein
MSHTGTRSDTTSSRPVPTIVAEGVLPDNVARFSLSC